MPSLKQPSEVLVYDFDFAARLGGETIASLVGVQVAPRGRVPEISGLAVAETAFAGQAARLRLTGGTDGEIYLVTIQVLDGVGQQYELDAEFAVVDMGFAVPEGGVAYLSAQAFVDRMGLDEALRLTDIIGNGRIDGPRLATALSDAQAEVDGYLAGLYAVPLSTVPALIAAIVFDLAVARLWTGNLPEGVKERRERAQRQLSDIAKRIVTLPGAAQLVPADASPAPLLFQTTERLFTRDRLRGF